MIPRSFSYTFFTILYHNPTLGNDKVRVIVKAVERKLLGIALNWPKKSTRLIIAGQKAGNSYSKIIRTSAFK